MSILQKLFQPKAKYRNSWELTDTIISIFDTVEDIVPEFISRDNSHSSDSYTCMRDLHNTCVYVHDNDLVKILGNPDFYDKEEKLLNISRLLKYKISSNCYPFITKDISPAFVSLKQVVQCKYEGIYIYVFRQIELDNSDELFRDLINIQNMRNTYI